MKDNTLKALSVLILLVFTILVFNLNLDTITGMYTGLPYEYDYEDAICWGNASFVCSECIEDCIEFGCNLEEESCVGEAIGSCSDYSGNDRMCTRFGCTWSGIECIGELSCGNVDEATCPGLVGCSWQEATCSGIANCTEILDNVFCGLAEGCAWTEATCDDSIDNDDDGLVDCNDPDCLGFSGCVVEEMPVYSNFSGRTTNFSSVDLNKVDNPILEKIGEGLIQWNSKNINVSHSNFDNYVKIGRGYVFLDSNNLNMGLNSSANITLTNIDWFTAVPIILRDENLCLDCIITNWEDGNISFTVPHFSNYSLGENSELFIYDEYEDSFAYNNTAINFFANYTNRTSGEHIPGALCNISFDDGSSVIMEDNNINYNYTKPDGFDISGIHYWNVSCSANDYETLIGVDNISISETFDYGNCENVQFSGWNKTFGGASYDGAEDIIQTGNCDLLAVGSSLSFGSGGYDFWILKIDNEGNHIWNKTFGGTQNEIAYSIIETNDRNFVITGYTMSFGSGEEDVWILKIDNEGNHIWNKTFGGDEEDIAYSLIEDSNFDLILAGYTNSYSETEYSKGWILKIDNEGNHIWNKTFGRELENIFYDIIEVDEGYILGGINHLEESVLGNPIWPYAWLLQINYSGDVISEELNFSTGAIYSLSLMLDDNIISAGQKCNQVSSFIWPDAWSFSCDYQPTIFKFDHEYNFEWEKTYSFLVEHTSSSNSFYDIVEDNNGNYVTVGFRPTFSNHITFLTAINPEGEYFWNEIISENLIYHQGKSLIQLGDETYAYSGSRIIPGVSSDMFISNFEIPIIDEFYLNYQEQIQNYENVSFSISINLTNNGTINNNYSINLIDDDSIFIYDINKDIISDLHPKQTDFFNISFTGERGFYNISFNITSEKDSSLYEEIIIELTLMENPGILSVQQLIPDEDTYVLNNDSFEYQIELRCEGGKCGNITVSLDPMEEQGRVASCTDFFGEDKVLISHTIPSYIIDNGKIIKFLNSDLNNTCLNINESYENKGSYYFSAEGVLGLSCFNVSNGDFFEIWTTYGECINSIDSDYKIIIPENFGSPFFTLTNNPLNYSNEPCLGDFSNGDVCTLSWDVFSNTTIGNSYNFFAIIESDKSDVDSLNSPTINITIVDELPDSYDPGDIIAHSSSKKSCNENWKCTEWGDCKEDNLVYRDCIDLNNCGTEFSKPNETKICEYYNFKLIDLKWNQLIEPQDINIGEMMRLRVFFPNNIYYVVDVYEIKENKVVLDIASRLHLVEYQEGNIKLFDVNGDGIDDFEIKVKNIYDKHVTINIRYLGTNLEDLSFEEIERNLEVQARYKKVGENWVGLAFGNLSGFDLIVWIFYAFVSIGVIYFAWRKWKK